MNIYQLVDKLVENHPIVGPIILIAVAIGIFASSIQSYMLLLNIKRRRKKKTP